MSQYLADIKETEFFIMDEEAHHVCTVARCKEGEEITVFNGKGLQYTGRIERIQKNFVRGSLLKKCLCAPGGGIGTLFCAQFPHRVGRSVG